MPDLDIAFLDRLADAADAATLPLFRRPIEIDAKREGVGDFDPVTEADRGAERAMRALIRSTFPDHGIIGEEYGADAAEARDVWHLDPVDGTRQFVTGVPLWGSLAGLSRDGAPMAGMLSQPFTRERLHATPDAHIYRGPSGERPLRAKPCARLADASLFTTSPHLYRDMRGEVFEALRTTTRLTRYGLDCYAFALVALGHADIAMETGVAAYDVMALVPLVEAAGGRMVHWNGDRVTGGGDVVAVGDPRLLDPVLAILGRA